MCAEYNENINSEPAVGNDDRSLIEKLEEAYKVYKLSELFLNETSDDYGKQKIGRLRYEFARHELLSLMQEASEKGIQWENSDMLRKYFYTDS